MLTVAGVGRQAALIQINCWWCLVYRSLPNVRKPIPYLAQAPIQYGYVGGGTGTDAHTKKERYRHGMRSFRSDLGYVRSGCRGRMLLPLVWCRAPSRGQSGVWASYIASLSAAVNPPGSTGVVLVLDEQDNLFRIRSIRIL